MKQYFIQRNGSSRLVLFFAGWGMDENPFRRCCPQRSDLMICYDYRTLDFDYEVLRDYHEVYLVAWSMGVWAASQVMSAAPSYSRMRIVQSTAINGTLYPVDEARGIAPILFQGTLEGLTETSLQKFQRRMCASIADYNTFRTLAPQRPVEALKEELAAIHWHYVTHPKASLHWNRAVIGANDRIFTPANQHTAWKESTAQTIATDDAHYSNTLITHYLENYG